MFWCSLLWSNSRRCDHASSVVNGPASARLWQGQPRVKRQMSTLPRSHHPCGLAGWVCPVVHACSLLSDSARFITPWIGILEERKPVAGMPLLAWPALSWVIAGTSGESFLRLGACHAFAALGCTAQSPAMGWCGEAGLGQVFLGYGCS